MLLAKERLKRLFYQDGDVTRRAMTSYASLRVSQGGFLKEWEIEIRADYALDKTLFKEWAESGEARHVQLTTTDLHQLSGRAFSRRRSVLPDGGEIYLLIGTGSLKGFEVWISAMVGV